MADQATMRAVLRDNGHDVPARGKLGAELVAAYNEISGLEPGDADYDAGVTEADFADDFPPTPAGGGVEDGGPAAGSSPGSERRPRRVRTSHPSLRARLKGIQAKPKPRGPGKAKPRRPRVPVDRLIGRGYEALGRVFMQVSPPIGRCISWQAPTAGIILEGVVRDTWADRALQPIARAEEKGEAIAALAGPPILIGMLQAAQGLPDDQRAMREAFIVPLLREALALNVRIAGDKMLELAEREREMGPVYEQVDKLIGMMFAPPGPPPAAAAQDAQAATVQAMAGV